MVFPSVGLSRWRAAAQVCCVDSTRSVAVRVVVAVAHGALGHLAPVAACSAGGAHAPRTRPCSACCPGCRTGAGLHAGPRPSPAGAGLAPRWLRQRGRCRAAQAVMPPGGSLAAGALGLRIGARLGAGFGAASAVLGAGRAAGAAWLEPQRCPPRATPRQAQQSRVPPGRRLYRGGGASRCRWHHCRAGIGRCRRADLGPPVAARWPMGPQAWCPATTRPARRPRRSPQAERCIFGSRAARFGRCRLWRQRPGRWSRGFGWRSRGSRRLWRRRIDWCGRDLRCFRAGTGAADARGDVSPSGTLARCLRRRHDWALALALALAQAQAQEQAVLHLHYLHRSCRDSASDRTQSGVLRGAAGSAGYPAADPPRLKGCRARAPAGRAGVGLGIG